VTDDPGSLPDLADRTDYGWGSLDETTAGTDPIELLSRWLADARDGGIVDFNAMAVATVGAEGQPSARNVLLRGIGPTGQLRFFTNRNSRKGTELADQPRVGLLFSWLTQHRQVRVDGVAAVTDDAVSDDYFASRPRDSRVAAWASAQSEVIADRGELESSVEAIAERFAGAEVTRPPFWGGYAVTPHLIEFWQGRPSRLHDRIRFVRNADGWTRNRLAP
jgi:pyridoxamine 5'-phosphate oxidase